MKSFFYRLPLILIFLGLSASAQDEVLTKQEAINLILENNLDIKVARNTRLIDENNADILNSGYLPSVTGNASGSIDKQNSEGVLANGDTRTAEGAETRRYSAAVNVNYTLFDGLGRYYNYKSFQERSEQSELEVRQTIENTILQLFTVYYEAARLTGNTSTLEQALENNLAASSLVNKTPSNGTVSPSETGIGSAAYVSVGNAMSQLQKYTQNKFLAILM